MTPASVPRWAGPANSCLGCEPRSTGEDVRSQHSDSQHLHPFLARIQTRPLAMRRIPLPPLYLLYCIGYEPAGSCQATERRRIATEPPRSVSAAPYAVTSALEQFSTYGPADMMPPAQEKSKAAEDKSSLESRKQIAVILIAALPPPPPPTPLTSNQPSNPPHPHPPPCCCTPL